MRAKGTFYKAALLLTAHCSLLATLASSIHAATNTGASFLRIDTGARPAALGGAYTAIADDVNAMYYNPGGLASLKLREVGATHAQWLLGSTFDFFGYAQPTSLGTFGLGMTRLGYGSTDGRDASRQASSGFSATDTAYSVGFSRTLGGVGIGWLDSGKTGVGMNVKWLQSSIGQYSASALAFDLGATHRLSGLPLSFGASVLNLGQGMKFLDQTDPLPLTVSLGSSWRVAGVMSLALDVRREVYDQRTAVGVGTEYAVLSGLSLRAGYASQLAQAARGAKVGGVSMLGGLSGGIGLKFSKYRADYTFAPFGELGNVQRLSLGARF